MPVPEKFWDECKFSSFRELLEHLEKEFSAKDTWRFRGHSDASWDLQTTLERTAKRIGLKFNEVQDVERGLLRRFERYMWQYKDQIPYQNLTVTETLAMMQHFGAPTRLLDWTYSFYIALFFAVERAELNKCCAIWAIDHKMLRERAENLMSPQQKKIIRRDKPLRENADWMSIFQACCPIKMVYPHNPFRQTSRHIIQQGAFTIPGDLSVPFKENLFKTLGDDGKKALRKIIIRCSKEMLRDAMYYLYRVNITAETLYPGLDGFAKAMDMYVNIPVARPK